jgi:hypothetical protein
MNIIPEVTNKAKIISCEFVEIELSFSNGIDRITRYSRLSSGYKVETINGNIYPDLGVLLSVSETQRDIASSGSETAITLSGIDLKYMYLVNGGTTTVPIPFAGQPDVPVGYYPMIIGSIIRIYRGFYNDNGILLTTPVLRFTGLVTNTTTNESRGNGITDVETTITLGLSCSNLSAIYENKVAGLKTNKESWRYRFPNDSSMDNVAVLATTQFDFGKDPVRKQAKGGSYTEPQSYGDGI